MVKYMVVSVLVLFLAVACGSDGVHVEKHIVSRDYLESTFGNSYGWTIWRVDDVTGDRSCDIYMMPMEEYRDEEQYTYYWGDEIRHCFEEDHHKKIPPGDSQPP